MEMPLVSIGLLTYNHEKYIASALEGILSQDYEQVELIILDDASCDKTPLIIEKYMGRMADRFTRVVNLKNQTNSGNISRNCNRIIREAMGIYYYGVSGDDILLPNAVSLLCKTLQKHPECNAVHANMIPVEDGYMFGDKFDNANLFFQGKDSGLESENLFRQLMYENFIAAPTVMLRKSLFDQYGYHDECIAYEDYEYWLRISRTERFYFLKEPVILYRQAQTSVTNFESEKNFNKLQISIDAGYSAIKKYVKELEKEEQIKSWQAYYNRYSRLCTQYHYQAGLKWLEDKRKDAGIPLDEYQADYNKQLWRRQREEEILSIWTKADNFASIIGDYLRKRNISDVAIYGYSQMGRILQNKLYDGGISVKFVIDQKGEMLGCQLPVYTMEMSFPPVGAVIVAPVGLYKIVELPLRKKTVAQIIDLDQMMKELDSSLNFVERIQGD